MSAVINSSHKKSAAKGLGKGINILIPDMAEESLSERVLELGINEIEPNRGQPRTVFDDEALAELAASIALHGVIQPIIVRKENGYYEIVAGERRWRAARMAGLSEVPVILRDYGERELLEVGLIENLQRENLNPEEEACAYKRLRDEFKLTQEEIADKVGKKRSTVANSIRLLSLPEDVLELVRGGKLTAGHAKALLSVNDSKMQSEAAAKIAAEDLSVRQTEQMMRALSVKKKQKQKETTADASVAAAYRRIEKEMSIILGTRVRLLPGKNKSKMEIDFFSDEDLSRLFELFKRLED